MIQLIVLFLTWDETESLGTVACCMAPHER